MGRCGSGWRKWLQGLATTEQVGEIVAVLEKLTRLVSIGKQQRGHEHQPIAYHDGAVQVGNSWDLGTGLPKRWPTNQPIQTCLLFDTKVAIPMVGSGSVDDWIFVNNSARFPATGSIYTQHVADISTVWNPDGTNTLELWDCGDCAGTNNYAYLSPFSLIHVLDVPVLSVDFVELWETSNRVNRVFNPTPKDDPPPTASNKIYVVESPDSLYHVTLDVNNQPAFMRPKLMYAVFVNGSKLSGSDGFFPALGSADITFDHPSLSGMVEKDFELRVGYDLNDNSSLDTVEEVSIFVTNAVGAIIGPPIVCGTSALRYPVAMAVVDTAVLNIITLPHASRLLRIFRDGTAAGLPDHKAPSATNTISFNCYSDPWTVWLTHNAGAPFNASGTAAIQYYVWGTNTSLANLVCNSYQMKPQVEAFYHNIVLPIANAYFATNPVGTITNFPLDGTVYDIPHTDESPSWVTNHLPGATITFDHPYQYNGINDDINGTIARGRIISHTAKFTLERKSFLGVEYTALIRTHVTGVVEDIYDFNRVGEGAGIEGAIIQIGHGNGSYGVGRTPGIIYRNKIEIDQDITF